MNLPSTAPFTLAIASGTRNPSTFDSATPAGKHPVCLVTSIHSKSKLSESQAGRIYARRWGVELFYRHAKQTFDKRKLRSHNASNINIELQWSIVGLWVVSWLAIIESTDVPPSQISFAKVLRAIRSTMREYKSYPDEGEDFLKLLWQASIDNYERQSKSSRDYSRKKTDRQSAGKPTIANATRSQISEAKKLQAA